MATAKAKNILCVAIFGVVATVACIYFFFSCLPVSTAQLNRLERGMTTNEVAAILGQPVGVHYMPPARGETNQWRLESSLMWDYESWVHFWSVDVFFDQDGRYTSYWKD